MRFEIYPTNSLFGAGWRWRLRAANQKIVASGESYNNKADCLHAVGLLMDTTRLTPVVETAN